MDDKAPQKSIYKVTIADCIINIALVIFRFITGIVGEFGAMIADTAHTLSEFLTDIIVFIFLHIGNRLQGQSHEYALFIEHYIKESFDNETHVDIHVELVKANSVYTCPIKENKKRE
jgi:divalent metal cation (Fe/Co/Zn/Cd) transporter